MKNAQNDLFTELTDLEEEIVSGGGFFKNIGGWFKKAVPKIPQALFYTGLVVGAVFFGTSSKKKYVTQTDESGHTIYTPID